MRFSLATLGCKVNQYDAETVAELLRRLGHDRAEPADARPPDLAVLVTCCVTATAMRKCRQALRRIVRDTPGAAVLVLGCYSTYDERRLHGILDELGVPRGRRAVLGHHGDLAGGIERFVGDLCGGVGRNLPGGAAREGAARDARIAATPETISTRRLAAVKDDVPAAANLPPLTTVPHRQRAFVKVQDGCDAFCAYCIVPYARCRVYSRHHEDVLDECRALLAAGHRELVLCGVFLGAYGRETAVRRRWPDTPADLPPLVRRVAGLDGLWRVRLSSLEPGDVNEELLDVLADAATAAPHLHLPLQSGSPGILRAMNRQYTASQVLDAVRRVRGALDRPAVTTDVIVGFPGETDADFAATLDVVREAGFAKIHAFPFSAIPPTAAWRRRDEAPPPNVVRRRLAALADLEAELAAVYREQFVGEKMEGLVEGAPGPNGLRAAMTDRYQTVAFRPPDAGDDLAGRVVRLRIAGATDAGLAGELVGD